VYPVIGELHYSIRLYGFFDSVDLVIVLDFTGGGQNLVIIHKMTVFICLEYGWDGFLDPYCVVRPSAKRVCLTVGCAWAMFDSVIVSC
jgi:hypothetical protein